MQNDPFFQNSAIELTDLPHLESHTFLPIQRSYVNILYLSNGLTFLLLLVPLLIFVVVYLGVLHWLSFLLLIIWLALALFSLWFASASVTNKSYLLRQKDISYRTGVFFKDWITIPFTRVQHCELSRGVLDRSFGLAELRIYTAGGSGSDIAIPGLLNEDALRLKNFIIAKIKDRDEEE